MKNSLSRARFIESKTLISNQENIEIYYINFDVFSIGNQYFAFNEPDSAEAAWTIAAINHRRTLARSHSDILLFSCSVRIWNLGAL